MLNKIYGSVVSIDMHVQRLDARFEKLEKGDMCFYNQRITAGVSSFDEQFLNLFPLKSSEDPMKIEEMIKSDKGFEMKVVPMNNK